MALEEPVRRTVANTYTAEQSPAFFNNFLAQHTVALKPTKRSSVEVELTPRQRKKVTRESSPDPLSLLPQTPDTPSRKRKAAQALESPLSKRVFSTQNGHTPSSMTAPPNTSTPTPRAKLQVYVELPPVPKAFLTPSQKSKGKMREDSHDDLGGFGSISEDEESHHRTISSSVMSSGRRAAGDRDERGKLTFGSQIGDIELI